MFFSRKNLYTLSLDIIDVVAEAAEAILAIYQEGSLDIQHKQDDSPLTRADLASHQIITKGLKMIQPDIPVLSEESAHIPFPTRRQWKQYWLVDPLDGTKEFIKRNDEFTVNIALIENHRPILGVVHVPVTGVTYSATVGSGALKDGAPIHVRVPAAAPPVVVGSRSHPSEKLAAYLDALGPHDIRPMGSSLKICRVAEGLADIYPRLGPTSEWDTAAAHCVLEQAGGQLLQANGLPLRYGHQDSVLNPHFLACGDPGIDWLHPETARTQLAANTRRLKKRHQAKTP